MMACNELHGQRALVTGASRGIGKAIALELASQGAIVAGTATTAQGAQSISTYLKKNGYNGTGLLLNVTDQNSIDLALNQFQTCCKGMPTILVNNAAITRDNLLMRMEETQWDDVMNTNLKGIFRVTQAVIHAMRETQYGRIIQISSVSGFMGIAGQTNYASAKAALSGFTKALAREVGRRNITVNCVAPGFIETDMTAVLGETHKEEIKNSLPVGFIGQPQDIAYAVSFLASPRARYITGTTLHVNGGRYMI